MLNQKEIKQLVSLLKRIDTPHEGLPQPVFDALCSVVPFVSCELVIIGEKGILLTWREDKWWRGWHFPGGLLRYRESLAERIEKTVWDELGTGVNSQKFLFTMDYYQSVRCHAVSLVFFCQTTTIPKQGKFFKKMPKNIIDAHKELWEKIKLKYD